MDKCYTSTIVAAPSNSLIVAQVYILPLWRCDGLIGHVHGIHIMLQATSSTVHQTLMLH